MTIYHLGKIKDFLFVKIFPRAKRIAADPANDTLENVLARVPKRETEFIYHLDVTFSDVWPAFRLQLNAALKVRGIRVYNAAVTDLSRKTLQRAIAAAGYAHLQASRSGDPLEKLFVKPNFNYSGIADSAFHAQYPKLFPRFPKSVRDYSVKYRRDIPKQLWDSPDVQIEKFISNPENKYYRVGFWNGRVVAGRLVNPHLVKKLNQCTAAWCYWGTTQDKEIAPVIKLVRDVAAQMGFDYGAADVLVNGKGELYLCDINSTPGWGRLKPRRYDPGNIPSVALIQYLRDGTKS